MKKLIALMMALAVVLSLCACGSETPPETSKPAGESQPAGNETQPVETTEPDGAELADPGHFFTYQGVEIVMNAPAASIIEALGEPKSYTEETSCAFEGLDKTYYYGSFYLQTYPMNDVDYIYCLWLVDDSVTTAEGLYIGAPESAVEAALGAEAYNGSNAYVVSNENARFSVILDNGVVSSIQYDAVVE